MKIYCFFVGDGGGWERKISYSAALMAGWPAAILFTFWIAQMNTHHIDSFIYCKTQHIPPPCKLRAKKT